MGCQGTFCPPKNKSPTPKDVRLFLLMISAGTTPMF